MKRTIFTTALALVAGTTTTTLLINKEDNFNLIEVYFYGKDAKESRIKLSLQDINSVNKVEVYEESSWKKLSAISNNKKYFHLHEIASKFIKVQHYLNIVNMIKWNRKINFQSKPESSENTTIKCPANCTNCSCQFENKTEIFSYYLSNLNAPYRNSYLSPIQAHIKLTDVDLDTALSSESSDSKEMIGSLVYGWVDYKFKITNYSDDNFSSYVFRDDQKQTEDSSTEEKYYSNFPTKFKVKWGSSTSDEDNLSLEKIFKEIEHKTKLVEKAIEDKQKSESLCCTDDQDIVKRNWIYKEELSKIQEKVKNYDKCCTTKK